jgi:pimeloyl-ACP methyl ester carboxylesterase
MRNPRNDADRGAPGQDRHAASNADRELSTQQARLRFRDEGSGPALLLIHGWSLDLDMWEPQARALRDSFRIIRFDRRGFGLSAGTPSIAADVADALALCEHLGLESLALVGMSQGARIAAHLAARRPELVSRVAFDGAPAGILDDGMVSYSEIPMAAYRELVRAGRLAEFREQWSRHPLSRLHTRDAPTRELLERIRGRYRALDLEHPAADSAPLAPLGAESIRSPALIISGALDLDSRLRTAEALARALASSERAVVPEAGHMPNLDNPGAYNSALRAFLDNSGRGSP